MALTAVAMLIIAIVCVRAGIRRPWRIVLERSPPAGPYRESTTVRRAIERTPRVVLLAAFGGLLFAELSLVTLSVALVELRWDGIAVGLLPFAALGIAAGVAAIDSLRPDDRTQGRVRVIARGLLAYAIPLVGFGLLHEVVLEAHAGTTLSFGVVAVLLGAVGSACSALLLASCTRLDA